MLTNTDTQNTQMMISFSDRNVLLNYFLPTELVEGPIMSMLRPAFSQT